MVSAKSYRVAPCWQSRCTVLAQVAMEPLSLWDEKSLNLLPASGLHSRMTELHNAARACRTGNLSLAYDSNRELRYERREIITLLEDYIRACRAELQRRPSHCQEAPQPQPVSSSSSCMLLQLGHDEIGVVAHELCDPVRPLLAVNLSSTAKGLRVAMQAALAQLRQQRQEVNAFVALMGRATIAQLRNARSLELGSPNPNELDHDKPLTLAH